ncbi:MAG: DUF1614 domain-containing protein [Rhodocyclaceae bacterium]|nr:DUF1614 domain-containing protein [Rhodocyclaceae bacterium]
MTFPRLLLLVAALTLLAVAVQLQLVGIAFEKLGLSQESAYLLLMTTLFGSLVNVPLFSVATDPVEVEPQQEVYRPLGLPRVKFVGRTIVAVNVGGAVTPLAFSFYLLGHNSLALAPVVGVIAVVGVVAHATSAPVRGVGIGMPLFVAPLTAALVSVLFDSQAAAPLAYIGGTLGVLIGADLLRLGAIRKLGAPVVSIGGAGTFDGIFLTGLLAVLLA